MKDALITIFTPTYNRADTLYDCYISLISQTSFDFIWQVIDDGSTDDTENLVETWSQDSPFEIVYLKVENGGKARAINKSLEITKTKLWLCLDSDDILVSDAIDRIVSGYKNIEKEEGVCGFFSLRGKDENNPMQGVSIPDEVVFVTQGFVRYDLKIKPEYAHVLKTDVARMYKYPCIDNENYFPLSYVYDQIDAQFKYKVMRKPIMICSYRSDGLTKNKRSIIKKNPIGYMLYKKQFIKLAPNYKEKYKAVSTYVTACLLSKINPFKENDFKLLTIVFFPVGLLDFIIRYKIGMNVDFEIKAKNI